MKDSSTENIRVRFAPSPTGFMHVGNTRTALFNWLFAKKHGGTFILRIEDTDAERSSEKFYENIISELRWLGLNWDEGPDTGGNYGPYRQSLRKKVYGNYFNVLKSQGIIYPCYCQPEELDRRRKEALSKGLPPGYDNRCRSLNAGEIAGKEAAGIKPSWRFKVPEKKIVIDDIIRGKVEFDTKLLGDFVISKSDGSPVFHFAVCVDDGLMKVTHVIRGEDHLSNTPRHILLFEAMGFEPPKFAHLPMIMGPDGSRLSKRHGAVSVTEFRKMGYLPEALVNYLGLLGWAPEGGKEIISAEQMVSEFRLEKVNKSSAIFDHAKLNWISGSYIRNEDIKRITALALPYLKEAGLIKGNISEERMEEIERVINLVRPYLNRVSEVVDHAKALITDSFEVNQEDIDCLKEKEGLLGLFLDEADNSAGDDLDWKTFFSDLMKKSGLKGKAFYLPIRIGVTGSSQGPELIDVLSALGKDRCVNRVRNVLSKISN
ncbi:glutamate--tRNA ligase [Candidatus Auribacterota bacterium]